MAPSLTVGDAGELIASCQILGINHAPGYPLFSLFGKIFLSIIPIGDIAYKINLMSAFWGAATVFVLYNTLKNQTHSKIAFLSSLFFAFSFSMVRSSVQTEVFTLNAFFCSVVIYLMLKKPDLCLISFLFGLGLGNHHTLILMVPAILYLLVKQKSIRFVFSFSRFLTLSLLFILGFSIYIYLPVRSVKNPGFDVGNPETLSKTLRVIRRADYGTLQLTVGEKEKYTLPVLAMQAKRVFNGLSHQFGVPGMFLILIGFYHFFKTRTQEAVFISLIYLFSVPFFIFLGNLPFNPETEGILDRFYVMGNIPLCFMIFHGAVFFKTKKFLKALNYFLIPLSIAIVIILNYANYNWRNYFLAHDYGKNILKSIKPNSVLFMDGGDDTFYSTGYFKFAKKERTDVALYDRGAVVFRSPYGDDFRRLSKESKEERRKKTESEISKSKTVYFSTFNKDIMSPAKVEAAGILYTTQEKQNLFYFYSLRNIFENFSDYRSRGLQPIYFYLESLFKKNPVNHYDYLMARWPDIIWLRANVKIELAQEAFKNFQENKMREAKNIYEKIISFYPEDAPSMVNLGAIHEKLGDDRKALELYAKAMETDAQNINAYFNAAVIYWKRADWSNVVYYFGKVLERDPKNDQAKRYIQMARQNILQNQ